LERFRGKLSLENELLEKGLSKRRLNGGTP